MDIQKEKDAFLNVFQFFKSFKGIGFSEETEQFFLKKNKPNDAECLDVSNLNQMWRAWWARAKSQVVEGFEIGRLQDRITEQLDERQDLYTQINKGVAEKIELIIRDVAELPDRTSPEDWPEALIVTGDELEEILTRHLSEKCGNQEQSE